MRVWVTRAEPDAKRTAQALIAAGHRPVVSPLLEAHPLKAADALAKSLIGVGALAFTSAAGVRAFAALRPISDRHLTVFTVGQATARAAHEAGFVTVIASDGDVAALARTIAQKANRPEGVLLHPGAAEPAGDLIGDLTGKGVSARAVAVYETLAKAPSAELEALLVQDPPGIEAVLIHSGKAAQELAKRLEATPELSRRLVVVAISKSAAEPLKPFKFARRAIAEKANEAAMLARLGQ